MIRAEKHEVESIAASCATGLERAWAENDRLRDRIADQRDTIAALDGCLASRPALPWRLLLTTGCAGGLLGFAAAWVAWSVTG